MARNPGLRFQRIVLIGTGRNYEVSLFPGVNIIAGPIFTGKSSILQLIDYACGSNSRPTYDEILKCSSVLMECLIDGEVLTIQRSLTDDNSTVFFYEYGLDEVLVGDCAAVEIPARQTQGQNSLSNELMKRLHMDNIAVKTAPSQTASALSTFSLRDLFFLLYVDQDRMGLKKAFFENDTFRRIKWKAGFEVVHYLFDESATSLSLSLKDAENEYTRIETYLSSINTFLNQSSIPKRSQIEQQLRALQETQADLETKLELSKKKAALKLGDDRELVRQQELLERELWLTEARVRETQQTLSQLGKLLVQYGREKNQLEFLEETELAISPLPIVRCPACFQPVQDTLNKVNCYTCTQPLPQESSSVAVQSRLRAVKRRVKDLSTYIGELQGEERDLKASSERLRRELAETNQRVKRIQESLIGPEMKVTLELHSAMNEVVSKRSSLEESLRLREKAEGHDSNLLRVKGRIQSLKEELKEAESKRKSPDEVISNLSALYADVMKAIKFPAPVNPHLDVNTYLPMIRGQVYGALSSKGALSLAESAWHFAVLQYSLTNDSLFPRFLMLDSPLMQVGRDAADDEFKDQQIVDAFYAWLAKLQKDHSANFQLLIVDNRPPQTGNDLVTVRFTRGLTDRYGLIDDEIGTIELEPEITAAEL